MKKHDFVLPKPLSESKPTGVLDTVEKVRQASEELHRTIKPAFEKFQESKQAALEESTRRFLD